MNKSRHDNDFVLEQFAKKFLTSRMPWWKAPRNGITCFKDADNIMVSLILYREGQFQVELLISPYASSSFPKHRHPNVDSMEFPIAGDHCLIIDNKEMWTSVQMKQWLNNEIQSPLIPITHDNWHSGGGKTAYAFLSIQHWLNNVPPSSVGLDWESEHTTDLHKQIADVIQYVKW